VAAPWVESITDQNTRFSQIETIARNWLQADRPSAEAWLAKVNLPDDRKQRLLKQP
jgi:ABC-type proline/glycine betaine transport system substrate-binding protein